MIKIFKELLSFISDIKFQLNCFFTHDIKSNYALKFQIYIMKLYYYKIDFYLTFLLITTFFPDFVN